MNKKLIIALSSITLLAAPLLASAAFTSGPTPNTVSTLSVEDVINIVLNLIWPLFVGFAVIMFLVAGFEFLTAQGDPSKIGTARMAVLWGVVGVAMGLLA